MKTLLSHGTGICAYADYPITTTLEAAHHLIAEVRRLQFVAVKAQYLVRWGYGKRVAEDPTIKAIIAELKAATGEA